MIVKYEPLGLDIPSSQEPRYPCIIEITPTTLCMENYFATYGHKLEPFYKISLKV